MEVRNKMRKILIPAVLLMVMSLCLPANAQFAKVGTVGLKFLDIGVGGRALGMGEAFTAVANDASAIFWNPGGVANVETGEVFAGYTNWPADIHLYSTAVVTKTNMGHIGVSFTILNTGLMNRTTPYDNDGDYSGTFAFEDWAAGFTYSRFLTDRFSFGTTFKLVKEKLADWEDTGWAVDIGTYYETGFKSLRIGMAILNFGPDMSFDVEDVDGIAGGIPDGVDNDGDGIVDNDTEEEAVPLPLSFRAGVAMDIWETASTKTTITAELMHPSDNEEMYNFGGEYWLQDMFAIRAGWKLNSDEAGFTAGAGFKVPLGSISASFDYAYNDLGKLSNVHRGSFSFAF
jgi:long-subunit fatty acid transport protein